MAATRNSGKEVAVYAPAENYPVLDPNGAGAEAAEIVKENFGDGGIRAFDLDRITIPAGGSVSWEIPTVDGVESTQTIEGVIVAWATARSYWSGSLDEEGSSPPDCTSDNGVLGHGMYGVGSAENPDGKCADCPMNQWESAPGGRGKACKESRLLFTLLPGRVLPVVVSVPPTSLTPVKKYMLRLAGEGTAFYAVTTRLSLRKVDGQGAIKYSTIVPSKGDLLTAEMRAAAKAYGDNLKSAAI